jgi:hypothetical protein
MAKERLQQEGIAATREKAKKSIVGNSPNKFAPARPDNAAQSVASAFENMGI